MSGLASRVDVVIGFEGVAADDIGADVDALAELAVDVLAAEGVVGPAEMGLVFVATDVIEQLNGEYRGKAGPTDVLSFPIDDSPDGLGQTRLVGDVVVCPEVAARNAPEHAGSLVAELDLLVVHGVLHLLGWDHELDDDAARMQARERELLVDHAARSGGAEPDERIWAG